ncbi:MULTISPECIES: substrate-binding periplasmic protein [Kyrpidia]|nr:MULTISPECIES: transporter substrate-binding domain-containing protein [Kyrpidia]
MAAGMFSIAALLSLTACGASSSPQGSGTGDLLDKVKSSKVLSVAVASFPPLEYQDPATQQWSGVDIDILSKFASTLGAKLEVHSMAFPATIQSVASKRDDITANIFKTPEREDVLTFSNPVIKYVEGIIVNSDFPRIPAATVEGLQGKKIATATGTAEQAFVPRIPGAVNQSYNSVNEAFLALSSGRVDATFQPVMYAEWAVKKNPSLHIKVLGPVPESITGKGNQAPAGYYGVAKGDYSKRFLDELNKFLVQEQSNGGLKQILEKYGLTDPSYLAGLGNQSGS